MSTRCRAIVEQSSSTVEQAVEHRRVKGRAKRRVLSRVSSMVEQSVERGRAMAAGKVAALGLKTKIWAWGVLALFD